MRPAFAGTTSIPPDTTLKVASLGGRFTERRMDASHASAAAPPMPTRVAPPLGRSRSWAIRHRASRNRVGPTVSVTGAETAVRAAAAASASRAAVTCGSSRTTGRRTGPCRSSRRERVDQRRGGPGAVETHSGTRRGRDDGEPVALEACVDRRTIDRSGDPGDGVAHRRRVDVDVRLDVAAEEARLDALQAADGRDPVARVRSRAHRALPVRADAELRRGDRERASAGDELRPTCVRARADRASSSFAPARAPSRRRRAPRPSSPQGAASENPRGA